MSPGNRRNLTLLGGILGAIAGPTGLWLHMMVMLRIRGSSGPPRIVGVWEMFDRIRHSPLAIACLTLPFIATLVMMPRFIRTLENEASQPRARFYYRAVVAGVELGIFATAIITFILFGAALMWGVANPRPGAADAAVITVAAGGVVFGVFTALVVPIMMMPYIIMMGIPFGLAFGRAVRKHSQTSDG